MPAVFAVDACRTPIGKIKGALSGVRPDHLPAVVLAGLPVDVPGATVNRLCGSGMEALSAGARATATGSAGRARAVSPTGSSRWTCPRVRWPRTRESKQI